jgi:hypothetical protein
VKVAVIVGVAIVAAASAFGGYAIGRHSDSDGSEQKTAVADAQEIIGAYNRGAGENAHLVWVGKTAPHIWRLRVKFDGKKRFGCEQVNLKQFWHGQGTDFHGFGPIDARQCPPWAGA